MTFRIIIMGRLSLWKKGWGDRSIDYDGLWILNICFKFLVLLYCFMVFGIKIVFEF